MFLLINVICAIIKYSFYATIWYAAICVIRHYEAEHNWRKRKLFDIQKEPPREEE